MVSVNTLSISPPIVNSSCAWASDFDQLRELYQSPHTGAVTIRTATLTGFQENETHCVAFSSSSLSTINSYGYSPHPLSQYITWVEQLLLVPPPSEHKPIIISLAASSTEEFDALLSTVQEFRSRIGDQTAQRSRIGIEFNTSCPNIPGSPPKGYIISSDPMMHSILNMLAEAVESDETLTVGLKLPPYLYREHFHQVVDRLRGHQFTSKAGETKCPFSFITCTNTLGNTLMYSDQVLNPGPAPFAVPTALGGLAGECLHSLALGNVYTFDQLLHHPNESQSLGNVVIFGVGGVTNKEGVERMRKAGASVIGCATILGKYGVSAFADLS